MTAGKTKKPKIDYPCKWDYKVIGELEDQIRAAVAECLATNVAEREYSLEVSRSSGGGKYISLNLSLFVSDEKERNTIFSSLAEHSAIMMVM